MGSPWQYLGHFRRQETGLFASSQAIHTSHFALIQLCCHRSQPKPSATLHRACAGSAESVQGLSFIPRPRGGFCFKMFIYSTCFAVMRQIYFSFPLFQMAVCKKSYSFSIREGAFVTFLCKTEPQDIMNRMTSASMCVIGPELPSCILKTLLTPHWPPFLSLPLTILLFPLEKALMNSDYPG